jgi:hypothetical protein
MGCGASSNEPLRLSAATLSYKILHSAPEMPRKCKNCCALVYADAINNKTHRCPGNGQPHDFSDSEFYVLFYHAFEHAWHDSQPSVQKGWHMCEYCQNLYHDEGNSICFAVNQPHSGSGLFWLPHTENETYYNTMQAAEEGWRQSSDCGSLVHTQDGTSPSTCPVAKRPDFST